MNNNDVEIPQPTNLQNFVQDNPSNQANDINNMGYQNSQTVNNNIQPQYDYNYTNNEEPQFQQVNNTLLGQAGRNIINSPNYDIQY